MWSLDNRNQKLELIVAETVSPIFCQILCISWQRSYCEATRALGDVTAMSRGTLRAPSDPTARLLQCYGDLFPRRPLCACFEHVQNLAATSATLETLLRSAALPRRSMRSHNDPAAISGDLVDFADRSEVAVLCDWGIIKIHFDKLHLLKYKIIYWPHPKIIYLFYLIPSIKSSKQQLACKFDMVQRFCAGVFFFG